MLERHWPVGRCNHMYLGIGDRGKKANEAGENRRSQRLPGSSKHRIEGASRTAFPFLPHSYTL